MGITAETAAALGSVDDLAARYANPDIDGNGTIDLLEDKKFGLDFHMRWNHEQGGVQMTIEQLIGNFPADDSTIEYFCHAPSADTRAYTRAMCLEKYGDAVWAVNWERITFRPSNWQASPGQQDHVLLPTPWRGTKADNHALFAACDTPAMFVEAWRGLRRGATMNARTRPIVDQDGLS